MLVPLTYMLCFAIAYYGPNAEIMGNVKLTLWHFKSVLNIEKYMKNLFMLFSLDFISLVINWIILKTTCNINMFKTFQKLQSEFWLIMAVQQAYSTTEVIKFIIHISTGIPWITLILGNWKYRVKWNYVNRGQF